MHVIPEGEEDSVYIKQDLFRRLSMTEVQATG